MKQSGDNLSSKNARRLRKMTFSYKTVGKTSRQATLACTAANPNDSTGKFRMRWPLTTRFSSTAMGILLLSLICVITGSSVGWYSEDAIHRHPAVDLHFEGDSDGAQKATAANGGISPQLLSLDRMSISSDSGDRQPTMVSLDIVEIIRNYDQLTLAPLFPGMSTCPASMMPALTPLINEPLDEHGNRMLHIAARSGNRFAIWSLMQMGADESLLNSGQQTPLMALRCSDQTTRDAIIACLTRQDSTIAAVSPLRRLSRVAS